MRARFNFFFGSLLVACVFSAEAQVYWQGPAGTAADWFEPSNWTGGVVPVGVGVQITNGGIAEVSSGTVSNCTVDAGRAAGPGMLRVSAGEMTNCTLRAGYDGRAGVKSKYPAERCRLLAGSVCVPEVWPAARVRW